MGCDKTSVQVDRWAGGQIGRWMDKLDGQLSGQVYSIQMLDKRASWARRPRITGSRKEGPDGWDVNP